MTTPDQSTEPAAAPAPPAEGKVRKALGLSFLNTVTGKLGTLLTGVLLARILAPEDFGAFAVALVALSAVLAVNELGVSLALVRWPGDPRDIAPTVTTISLVSSAVLYAVCWFGAPAFSAALGAPEAAGVVRLLCASVLIDGATAAAAQFVNREFRQGVRLVVDLSNLGLSTGLTVVLALADFGPASLAWGRIVGNALSALLLFRLVSLWPRPGWDRSQARELIKFGLPLAGASLLVFAMLNVDYIVAGHLLGAVALGLYLQAFNLASWPVNMFSTVVRRVSLAAFAQVQHDPEERERALGRFAQLLALTALPVSALLGLLALPIIRTLYGEQWVGAAEALQFLAVLGMARVAGELAYDYLVALGLPGRTLWIQGIWTGGLVVALPIGALADGIRGVAAAHAVVAVVLIVPAYGIAVRRTGVSLRRVLALVVRPVLGCALLCAVVLGVRVLLDQTFVELLVAGLLGVLAYAAVVWPLRNLLRKPGF